MRIANDVWKLDEREMEGVLWKGGACAFFVCTGSACIYSMDVWVGKGPSMQIKKRMFLFNGFRLLNVLANKFWSREIVGLVINHPSFQVSTPVSCCHFYTTSP